MSFGCAFSSGFSDGFEICVTAPTTGAEAPRTHHPVEISIATGKPIDLLTLTDEELVQVQIALAGGVAGRAITHTLAVQVDRALAGRTLATSQTHTAAVQVDRVLSGRAVGVLRAVIPCGVINDDLEILYLAGVL